MLSIAKKEKPLEAKKFKVGDRIKFDSWRGVELGTVIDVRQVERSYGCSAKKHTIWICGIKFDENDFIKTCFPKNYPLLLIDKDDIDDYFDQEALNLL